jgi:type IV pilus assembly protein PilW
VVQLKVQYGIDTDGDGAVDAWFSGASSPWQTAEVMAAPAATLSRIKAVRVGIIVRSETYDRNITRPFAWSLFDCPSADQSQCAGRLSGALPAGWRYRVYETTVPLRNQIWNG